MKNIQFKNISSEHIKSCFLEALAGYPELQERKIAVIQRSIPKTTMRAQPVFNFLFWNKRSRHYKIELNDYTYDQAMARLEQLDRDVLVGWFAHELGHVMDYLHRSALNLIGFAIGYLYFPEFRLGAERRADIIAIEHGFADAILATKKFILEQSNLPNAYRKRIERYYMSPEEVALVVNETEEEEVVMIDKLL